MLKQQEKTQLMYKDCSSIKFIRRYRTLNRNKIRLFLKLRIGA
jgi:hypothetical protein